MVSQYCSKLEYKSHSAFANHSCRLTYNIVSVGYICPMNVLQCTATQCMCYKDIQMEEGTFKRKKDILSSYSTKSIFYLSTIQRLYKGQTFIYGLPGLV